MERFPIACKCVEGTTNTVSMYISHSFEVSDVQALLLLSCEVALREAG